MFKKKTSVTMLKSSLLSCLCVLAGLLVLKKSYIHQTFERLCRFLHHEHKGIKEGSSLFDFSLLVGPCHLWCFFTGKIIPFLLRKTTTCFQWMITSIVHYGMWQPNMNNMRINQCDMRRVKDTVPPAACSQWPLCSHHWWSCPASTAEHTQ